MAYDVQLPPARSPWTDQVRALRADLDVLTDRVTARLAERPGFRTVPGPELRSDLHTCLTLLVTGLLDPPDPAADGRRQGVYHRIGSRRAMQGVPGAELLRSWQVMSEEILRHARRRAPADLSADATLLRLAEELLTARGPAMIACGEGHRAAETERLRRQHHHQATLVRRLVGGSGPPGQLEALLDRFGMDPAGTWYAVRARPGGEDLTRVESHLTGGPPGDGGGVVALLDGDLCGAVRRLPTDPLPISLGVSGPVPLAGLPAAFRRATRALNAARALGRDGPTDLATLGVEAAVVADDDVGEAVLDRYVRPLLAQGAAGEVVLDTVSRYLANDARLDTTARELHVHVNTVRYRLGRFEQVTGSSLRSTDTVVEVWWALRRRSLRNG